MRIIAGHYVQPRVPDIPGAESFPGQIMHSHNYRHPEDFEGRSGTSEVLGMVPWERQCFFLLCTSIAGAWAGR